MEVCQELVAILYKTFVATKDITTYLIVLAKETINIKNQAGTKTIEVYNGQPIGNLIKSILLLEGVDRKTGNLLYSYIGAGIVGANFTPPTLEDLLKYEKELNDGKTDDEVSDEFNSNK